MESILHKMGEEEAGALTKVSALKWKRALVGINIGPHSVQCLGYHVV